MKVITNVSDEIFNHALFTRLEPGFKVLVPDEVAEQLLADHGDKFTSDPEGAFNHQPLTVVGGNHTPSPSSDIDNHKDDQKMRMEAMAKIIEDAKAEESGKIIEVSLNEEGEAEYLVETPRKGRKPK